MKPSLVATQHSNQYLIGRQQEGCLGRLFKRLASHWLFDLLSTSALVLSYSVMHSRGLFEGSSPFLKLALDLLVVALWVTAIVYVDRPDQQRQSLGLAWRSSLTQLCVVSVVVILCALPWSS